MVVAVRAGSLDIQLLLQLLWGQGTEVPPPVSELHVYSLRLWIVVCLVFPSSLTFRPHIPRRIVRLRLHFSVGTTPLTEGLDSAGEAASPAETFSLVVSGLILAAFIWRWSKY